MKTEEKTNDVQTVPVNEENYPSMDLVYGIALQSYEITQRRSDVADDRIAKLITFALSLNLAVVTIVSAHAKGNPIVFSNCLFIAAMIFFVIGIATCIVRGMKGSLRTLSPSALYKESLGDTHWEFMKNIIYWSGENFQTNKKYVNGKANAAILAAFIFAAEGAAEV
jgi:hypothetical protein